MEYCSWKWNAADIVCERCGTVRTGSHLKTINFSGDLASYKRECRPDALRSKANGCCGGTRKNGKLSTFVSAIRQWSAAGFPLASKAKAKERMAICKTCEHHNGGTCNACGCWLIGKVKLETEKCPLVPPKW